MAALTLLRYLDLMRSRALLLAVAAAFTVVAQTPSTIEVRFRDPKTNKSMSLGRARTLTLEAGSGVALAGALSQADDNITLTVSVDTAVIASVRRVQSGQPQRCMPSSRSGVSYACNMLPALESYERGQPIIFFPDATSLANPTLNVAGLGPRPLKKKAAGGLVNLQRGDLIADLPYLLVSTDQEFVVLQ